MNNLTFLKKPWKGKLLKEIGLECGQVCKPQESVLVSVLPNGDCDSDSQIFSVPVSAWLSCRAIEDGNIAFGGRKLEQCLLSKEIVLTSQHGIIETEHEKNRTLCITREAIQIIKSYPVILQWQGEGHGLFVILFFL